MATRSTNAARMPENQANLSRTCQNADADGAGVDEHELLQALVELRAEPDGGPALLLALDIALVAAPLAEEIAFETLAIGASAAAAFGDQGRAPSAA